MRKGSIFVACDLLIKLFRAGVRRGKGKYKGERR